MNYLLHCMWLIAIWALGQGFGALVREVEGLRVDMRQTHEEVTRKCGGQEMKFEPGKYYKTRRGKKAVIYADDGSPVPQAALDSQNTRR